MVSDGTELHGLIRQQRRFRTTVTSTISRPVDRESGRYDPEGQELVQVHGTERVERHIAEQRFDDRALERLLAIPRLGGAPSGRARGANRAFPQLCTKSAVVVPSGCVQR